jgi:hypothetical protein
MQAPRPLIGLSLGLALVPGGEGRTLTSADGRIIEAEVVGFEGIEKVAIKRADTGRTFTVAIDSFGESDRAALRAEAAEAAKKPKPLPAGAVALELGRVKFAARREKQDIALADGSTRRDAITVTEEDWGYSVTLRNTTLKPIENLRGEYILFVKVDTTAEQIEGRDEARIKRSVGALEFEPVPAGGRITARTQPIVVRKRELANGIVWAGSREAKTRDTLHGIWLRIYQGETLVLESASPGTLSNTESWSANAGLP